MVSCRAPAETIISKPDFEIYLATTESVREFGYYDTDNLILNSEPVLTGDDIRIYFWPAHIIEVNGSFMQKISENASAGYDSFDMDQNGLRRYLSGGSRILEASQNMCFVVVVNGEKLYSGTFPSGQILSPEEESVILGDIADDRIAVVFTDSTYDVRNNDKVYEFFKNANKLGQMSGEDSSEMVLDLQNRLEESEDKYLDLLKQYNDLKSGINIRTDYRNATIEWLKNRLDLYALETQEGSAYKQFSDGLLELDLSKVESIGIAADIFRRTAVASTEINDRMFNVFEELYYVVIDGIPRYNSIDEINEAFVSNAANNWISVEIEGGKINAYPSVGKLRENFGVFLSKALNDYLLLSDLERGVLNSAGTPDYINEGNIAVDINDIAEFLYLWEKFTWDYPYSYPFNFKSQSKSEDLMDIYIGLNSVSVSDLYDSETYAIKDEVRLSYENFIMNYPKSQYNRLIQEYYGVLKDNGFIYTQDVLEYVKNINYEDYR